MNSRSVSALLYKLTDFKNRLTLRSSARNLCKCPIYFRKFIYLIHNSAKFIAQDNGIAAFIISASPYFFILLFLKDFYASVFLVNDTPTTLGPALAATAAPIW